LATHDFKWVADSIAIGVSQAVPVTIVTGIGISTGTCISSRSIIITSRVILTSNNFIFITHTIAVGIVVTVAIAVEVGDSIVEVYCILTQAVVSVGKDARVTGNRVGTTSTLILVTDAITVSIIQAITTTINVGRSTNVKGIVTISSISRRSVVVTGDLILATDNLKVVANAVTVCI